MQRREQAEITIRDHTFYALAGAALPLPLLDVACVTAIQLAMIRDLAETWDVDHDPIETRSVVAALAGATLPRVGASLVKALPGVGWVTGMASQAVLSAASTWALGQVFSAHFASRRPLGELDTRAARAAYQRALDDWVRARRPEPGAGLRRPIGRVNRILARLERLREEGVIDDATFASLRSRALGALAS